MQALAGKVALVTGAGRHQGLGKAICAQLAADGCRIALTDLGEPKPLMEAGNIGTRATMDEVAAELSRIGPEVIALPMDVTDEAQIEAAIASVVARFGRLDILINNAGIGYLFSPIVETPAGFWKAVMDVNLLGPFLCTKHASRQMIKQGTGGRIVNIASQAAKSGHPHLAAYIASKHGLVGLTRTSALELGSHGITVNAVCPNHVTTGLGAVQNEYYAKLRGVSVEQYLDDMKRGIPLGRVGLPEDTAKACAFLCSEAAQYITGEAMNVSGGAEMH
jgi:meso-butanediol dehydrogenase/(S,S)-butanediol dehydrogenase/diacetyl reductase